MYSVPSDPKGHYDHTISEHYYFYGHQPDRRGWMFSNFSPHPVTIGGLAYPTTEHYYQAAKYFDTNPEHAENIRLASTPSKAKKLGNDRSIRIDPDWEQKKYAVMIAALKAKINAHPSVLKALLNTDGMYMAEHTKNDKVWGDGLDGSGKNLLGKAWMEVRHSANQRLSE